MFSETPTADMTKYLEKFGIGGYKNENQPGIQKKLPKFRYSCFGIQDCKQDVIDVNKCIQIKI